MGMIGYPLTGFIMLVQSQSLISNFIYHGLFYVQCSEVMVACFVDVGGIADHHCLSFLFIKHLDWVAQNVG